MPQELEGFRRRWARFWMVCYITDKQLISLSVELELSGCVLPVVLTVFEENPMEAELILGVDVLTAYGASVDFKVGVIPVPWRISCSLAHFLCLGAFPVPWRIPSAFAYSRCLGAILVGLRISGALAYSRCLGAISVS